MKKLILAMMIVPLLCACNSTSKYSYVDNSDTLEKERKEKGQ